MHAPHQEGRARPSLFFDLDLTTLFRWTPELQTRSACWSMDNLSSAAAQGEQAYEPHHADGYNFTGVDPSVRTLEDAVRQIELLTVHTYPPRASMRMSTSVAPVSHPNNHHGTSDLRSRPCLVWYPGHDQYKDCHNWRLRKVRHSHRS